MKNSSSNLILKKKEARSLMNKIKSFFPEVKSRKFDDFGRKIEKLHPSHAYLGSGVYGCVIQLDNNMIVKICCTKKNENYLKYAAFAHKYHETNTSLPKVYLISTLGKFSFIFMERLFDGNDAAIPKEDRHRFKKSLKQLNRVLDVYDDEKNKDLRTKALTTHWNISFQKMKQTITGITNISNEFDIHEDNIMVRAPVFGVKGKFEIVLTDPVT